MSGMPSSPRFYSWDWALDKLVTPVIIGVILAVFGLLAPTWIANRLQPPTCQDPKDLVQIVPSSASGKAKPPDSFPVKGRVTYEASNLIDGNTSTAWVEGQPGLGLGSQFVLRFGQEVDIQLICIVNGYAESWDLYKINSRARLLDISSEQGDRSALLADAASPDKPAIYQQANCPQGKTRQITFTLKSAYAPQRDTARTQTYADTAISEIEIWSSK